MLRLKNSLVYGSLFISVLGVLHGIAQTQDTGVIKPRPFSVSADIREEYDDNIFTTNSNQVASMKTVLEPSFLFNYPMENTAFSARYTMDASAYYHRDNTWDLSHDFLARVNHSFNDRFNIDARDRIHYSQEPEVDQGAVVARVVGDYLNNTFTSQGTMLWTTKFSTVSTYTNDYFDYRSSDQTGNDRMANTFAQDLRFQVAPVATMVFGATYTDLNYYHDILVSTGAMQSRNWDSLSPYVGVDYSLTPEWTVSPRLGLSYTTYQSSVIGDTYTPYATLTSDWKTGKDSSITFVYAHSVSQTDLTSFGSQESDSFSLTGRYQVAPLISTHITGYYNLGQDNSNVSLDPTQGTINENTLGFDLGAGYDITKAITLEIGYDLDYVTSDITARQYTRNRIYLGVRGSF